ncbi:MAG: pinensin family lanthipeptide [Bacteroidota bacterium]
MSRSLKLQHLSVKSFITSQNYREMQTIKGGLVADHYDSDGPPHTSSDWSEIHHCNSYVDRHSCVVPYHTDMKTCPTNKNK